MSYNDLLTTVDPIADDEYRQRGEVEDTIKTMCRALYKLNPNDEELRKLAEHFEEKYKGKFPELSLRTLRERKEMGACFPEPEDWNPDLSYSAHKAAKSIEKVEARRKLVREARTRNGTPITTASEMRAEVKNVRRRLKEIVTRKKRISDKDETYLKKLNWAGSIAIRDPENDDVFDLRAEIRHGVVTLSAQASIPMEEPEFDLVAGGTKLLCTIQLDTEAAGEDDDEEE